VVDDRREVHAQGAAAGDVLEAEALGRVFGGPRLKEPSGSGRPPEEVYVPA